MRLEHTLLGFSDKFCEQMFTSLKEYFLRSIPQRWSHTIRERLKFPAKLRLYEKS